MSKPFPPPPFDDDDDEDDLDDADDDEDDDVESQDLLTPSQEEQESQSCYSPSQHAQPFDAPPRRAFLSSPVEDSRQFSELIHPPHDTSVQNSPLADRAIAYGDDDSDVSVCHRRRPSARSSILLDDDDYHGGGNEEDDNDDGNGGVDDDVNNNEDNDEGGDDDDDDDNDDDDDVEYSRVDEDDEGTFVPGTAYDTITAVLRRNAVASRVPVSTVTGVDPIYEHWIRIAMLDDWRILAPHEWQIRAIADIAFSRDTATYLIAKTGSGKSAVPLTVGSILTGITLTMVPLVGLGSDQVNKCCNPDNFIEGYHLDEHRGRDGALLRKRLLSLTEYEADNVSIFLYASPQSLQVGTEWYRTLMDLSAKNFIRLIVVDEAHSVAQDGRDFRPEFKTAVTALRTFRDKSPTPCKFLAMSATFRRDDQDEISRLWKQPPTSVIWMELSRRGIRFEVVISGNPTSTMVKAMAIDYSRPTSMKTIVYTNSKMAAMGGILNALENLIEKCEALWRRDGYNDFIPGRVISFTGDDGLQQKVHIMRAWACSISDMDEGDDNCDLPNLLIMPATKAADCGVSSSWCRRSYRVGLAPSLYAIVQEMGRVDRVHNAIYEEVASNRYEVHLSFTCAVKLYARIMTHPERSERDLQLASMISVLQFLVIPPVCQHVMLEQYFEDTNTTRLFDPCNDCCNKCRRSSLTGRINRRRLTRLLVGSCSKVNSTTTGALVKFIKDNQRLIFHRNDQPKKGMGPIHAICLQLIATGILKFGVGDGSTRSIGKNELNIANIVVTLGQDSGEARIMFDEYWTYINTSEDED